MFKLGFVLACLACVGYGRRGKPLTKRVQADTSTEPLSSLATLLLSSNPTAAFNPPGLRAQFSRSQVVPSHQSDGRAQLDRVLLKEEKSVEEVTEKYGLEAGLFSAFKRGGDKAGSMQQAGDLLKKYGGAYLLTSTSLAAVSFALCYYAVDNGIDVASLLKNVGLEVSQTSETVGTVGLAYAIHKAASPIRFPPTVALTPIVASKLFGKEGDGEIDGEIDGEGDKTE